MQGREMHCSWTWLASVNSLSKDKLHCVLWCIGSSYCGLLQEAYQAYENHQNNAPVAVLRDALRLEPAGPEIDLDEVEPAEEIMKRFCTGGMSLGAISRETHETISIAMNRINGK